MDPELDHMNYKHLNNPKGRKEVVKLMDELDLILKTSFGKCTKH